MKKVLFQLLLIVLAALTLTPGFARAGSDADRDIMLVLDNSGSMRQNDPQFLTKKVVSDFVAGLSADIHAGIVIFDEEVDLSIPLSPLATDEARQKITSSLSKVTYSGKYTDSPAGIERAIYELKSQGRKEAAKIIVFITDGIVDTGDKTRDMERARWLREDLAGESARLGIRIFGIAFTDQADFQLIQALGERTGGGYFRAATVDDIGKIFGEIDATLKQTLVKPSKDAPAGNGGSMVWIIATVGVFVLGIVAIVFGRGKKSAGTSGSEAAPPAVKMPKASLRDIREITGKHEYPITSPVFSIGRAPTNPVVINKPTISTRHATIEFRNDAFYLVDQRSTNGTFLNGKKISDAARLKHGDRIAFETCEFVFAVEEFIDQEKTQLVAAMTSPSKEVPPPPHQEGSGYEPPTRLKDMCPNHPSWKATEVCSVCQIAYCEKCIREKDGRKICVKCDTPAE